MFTYSKDNCFIGINKSIESKGTRIGRLEIGMYSLFDFEYLFTKKKDGQGRGFSFIK
jgi:hypothetical protein